jgi:hypothetical protein
MYDYKANVTISNCTGLVLSLMLAFLALFNFHLPFLLLTSVGKVYQGRKEALRLYLVRNIAQLVISISVLTTLFVIDYNGNPRRVFTIILFFYQPMYNLCINIFYE